MTVAKAGTGSVRTDPVPRQVTSPEGFLPFDDSEDRGRTTDASLGTDRNTSVTNLCLIPTFC